YWFGPGTTSYVAVEGLRILGMYKFRANQRDLGSHVANASFMVDPAARGTGTGTALGYHCLHEAQNAGYEAMQFNFVVSTNTGAPFRSGRNWDFRSSAPFQRRSSIINSDTLTSM